MTAKTATLEITRLNDLRTSRRDMLMMDPRIIQVEKSFNPRNYSLPENRAHLNELKASIRVNGTLNPLLVRYDGANKSAILVDGECRLRANLELIEEGVEIISVPCIQVSGNNEAERLVIALTANTGKPLSKWEIGNAFARLQRFGWETEQIATRLGFSERFIKEALELSDAPQSVKELLSERAVTPSLALDHIRQHGSNASITLSSKVAEVRAKGGSKAIAARPRTTQAEVKETDLLKMVKNLLKEVEQKELDDTSEEWVPVKRTKLKNLAALVGGLNG